MQLARPRKGPVNDTANPYARCASETTRTSLPNRRLPIWERIERIRVGSPSEEPDDLTALKDTIAASMIMEAAPNRPSA